MRCGALLLRYQWDYPCLASAGPSSGPGIGHQGFLPEQAGEAKIAARFLYQTRIRAALGWTRSWPPDQTTTDHSPRCGSSWACPSLAPMHSSLTSHALRNRGGGLRARRRNPGSSDGVNRTDTKTRCPRHAGKTFRMDGKRPGEPAAAMDTKPPMACPSWCRKLVSSTPS